MEEVLAKYFSNEATMDERKLVESWRSDSKENAEAFFEAKSVWLESALPETPSPAILDHILNEPTKEIKVSGWMLSNWMKYAAAAVLVVAIGLLFVLNNLNAELNYTSSELADGSEIVIHGDSKLEVMAINKDIREVRITGKAYFQIERDEKRPFIIHTGNAEVKVLGTSFVVDTYSGDTEVRVESGQVELMKGDKSVSLKLSKGEMGLVSDANEGIIKRNNHDLNYLSWKTKVLTFKDSKMSEVAALLEEVYGIEVVFENPQFMNCKLTAKFNKKKAKDAVEIIARTFNVAYDYKGNKVILKGKGC